MARIRIIGGQWRGRRIEVQSAKGLRPTLDQTRETLFNWLAADLPDARCLDLFAGSGALGFEALSRGAEHVDFVEYEASLVRGLKSAALDFGAGERATIRRADSDRWLTRTTLRFDLIFLDPPWKDRAHARLLSTIASAQLLLADGYVYFETDRDDDPEQWTQWQVVRHKTTGASQYGLLQVADAT